MGKLIDKLRDALLGHAPNDSGGMAPALLVTVECEKCGERITTRIEKAYELQDVYPDKAPAEGEEEQVAGYILHKELVGANCQNIINLELTFDTCRQITGQSITGGKIISIQECS